MLSFQGISCSSMTHGPARSRKSTQNFSYIGIYSVTTAGTSHWHDHDCPNRRSINDINRKQNFVLGKIRPVVLKCTVLTLCGHDISIPYMHIQLTYSNFWPTIEWYSGETMDCCTDGTVIVSPSKYSWRFKSFCLNNRSTTSLANANIGSGTLLDFVDSTNFESCNIVVTPLWKSLAVTLLTTVVAMAAVAVVVVIDADTVVNPTADTLPPPTTSHGAKNASAASFVKCFPLHFSLSVSGVLKWSLSLWSSMSNDDFDFRLLFQHLWSCPLCPYTWNSSLLGQRLVHQRESAAQQFFAASYDFGFGVDGSSLVD